MSIIKTPHIQADPADFARTVLMPGDQMCIRDRFFLLGLTSV